MPPPTLPILARWQKLWNRDELAQSDIDDVQFADAIWLAAHMPRPVVSVAASSADTEGARDSLSPEAPLDTTAVELMPSAAVQQPPVPRFPAPSSVSAPGRPAPRHWISRHKTRTSDPSPRDRNVLAAPVALTPDVGPRRDRAGLFRTLRPLKLYCSSPLFDELDERRTAEASADAGALILRFSQREERWVELAVLIDVSPSMALWQDPAWELLHVLSRLGTFRSVVAWSFDGDETPVRFRSYPHRSATGARKTISAEALAGSAERRTFLVISDGVGRAWRQADMAHVLGQLARHSHVSLIDPLPHRMWHRSGIGTTPMFHRVTGARDRLSVRFCRTPWSVPDRGKWLPVWHLDEDELGAWARLLAGAGDRDIPGESLELRAPDADRAQSPARPAAISPADQVARLRASVSSGAFTLATRLAAVPLSLPLMRMLHAAVLPDEGIDRLAEILLSGILIRQSPRLPHEDPDQVVYDFAPGIRERLLALLTRAEALAALKSVARAPDAVARVFGGTLNFRLLTEPDGGAHPLPEQAKYFAGVAVTVLKSLGPAYADLADGITVRLEQQVADEFWVVRDRQFTAPARSLTIVQVDGPARDAGDGATLADLLADRITADADARPDLLVACENLAAAATSEEAARSTAFFGRLLERFDLSADRLILAPAPIGWQGWGNYEYARAVAGRNLTSLLGRILGQPERGDDGWWHLDLPEHEVSLTILDSTQLTGSTRLGELGARQLAWLRAQLDAPGADERPRVVIMHHDPATRLRDGRAFRDAVPGIDLLMHGWGPSASATALASNYASAPAVPDPAAGYIAYKMMGQQVATRGQAVLPVPATASVITSSIFLTARPASRPTEALVEKAVGLLRPAPMVTPYGQLNVSAPVQER